MCEATTRDSARAAFGGATSMTVMQMLEYASSQYVGNIWYGGVKSLQGLAKDAFDAINNQWVFAPWPQSIVTAGAEANSGAAVGTDRSTFL
jgi:hypothetical protein